VIVKEGLEQVFPEYAWMAEKTTDLARASCSTNEHIGHLLHAWRKALSAGGIQALCSAAPPWPGKIKAENRCS